MILLAIALLQSVNQQLFIGQLPGVGQVLPWRWDVSRPGCWLLIGLCLAQPVYREKKTGSKPHASGMNQIKGNREVTGGKASRE